MREECRRVFDAGLRITHQAVVPCVDDRNRQYIHPRLDGLCDIQLVRLFPQGPNFLAIDRDFDNRMNIPKIKG